MKVTTDCSVTSRPLRTRSKFDPKSLFTGGEQGVLIGPNPVDKVFADTTASSNALFGNSVARIDDQSGSSHNSIQFSTSLRPLLGRAPITGVTMNGSGIAGSACVPMAGVYRVSFDIASSDPSGFGVRVTTTNPVSNSVFVNAPGSYSFFVYPSVGSIRLNHGQASNLQLVNIEYRQMVVQEAS